MATNQKLKPALAHVVGFYVCSRYQLLDLAGPLGAFEMAGYSAGRVLYNLPVFSRTGGQVKGSAGVCIDTSPIENAALNTLIVIGGDILPMSDRREIEAFQRAATQTPRVASICTGAFLLAETGLLDAKRATTHWDFAVEFQRRYPLVTLDTDRIFVKDGHTWTSAGITAGIDLALALIEEDHGSDLARSVAKQLVVYHRRPGSQTQLPVISDLEPDSDRIRVALTYARDHLAENLSISDLANVAKLSTRQFTRAFKRETGETAAKAVERMRVEAAYVRLREGSEPLEMVARMIGFIDGERMRRSFISIHGKSPQSVRRDYRSQKALSGH